MATLVDQIGQIAQRLDEVGSGSPINLDEIQAMEQTLMAGMGKASNAEEFRIIQRMFSMASCLKGEHFLRLAIRSQEQNHNQDTIDGWVSLAQQSFDMARRDGDEYVIERIASSKSELDQFINKPKSVGTGCAPVIILALLIIGCCILCIH